MKIMQAYIIFLFLILLNKQVYLSSIQSVQLINGSQSIYIYSNQIYNNQFIEDDSEFSCSLKSLYTYNQTPQQLQNNENYQISIQGAINKVNISITTQYNIINPTFGPQTCLNNCTITIKNNCPNPVSLFAYFDKIHIQISSMQTITYYVLCNSSFQTDTFQVGELIIILFCILVISLTSIFSRAWAFQRKGFVINYIIIGVFCICLAIGGIILLFASNVAQIIAEIIIWVIGLCSFIICINQLIFKFQISQLLRTLINLKTFPFRIIDLISLTIGLGLMFGWTFSNKNWILNNLISLSIIISIIKLFKITSFKKGLILYLIMQIIQVVYLILIDVLEKVQYQQFLINNFNNPFEIQLPTINPVYGQKCSWISLSSIIYPGVLIQYFRRFDASRNTRIYLITSIILFTVGSILWIIISLVSPVNIAFGVIAQPLMLGLICLFAYNRKQIKILWNGKFYDTQFKNQENQLNDQLEMETRKPAQFIQQFLDGLAMNYNEDSSIDPIENLEMQNQTVNQHTDNRVQKSKQ